MKLGFAAMLAATALTVSGCGHKHTVTHCVYIGVVRHCTTTTVHH